MKKSDLTGNFFNHFKILRADPNEPMVIVPITIIDKIKDLPLYDMLRSDDKVQREMAKDIILKKFNYNIDKMNYE